MGSSGSPSDALWAAAGRARQRGQRLTLCTARLAAGPTQEWATRLDPDGWHIFHTGAALWHPGTGEVDATPLPDGALAEVAEVAAARGWVIETYSWNDYVVDSDDPLAHAHARLLDLPLQRRSLDSLGGQVVRVQLVVPSTDTAAAIAAAPTGTAASGATSPMMPGASFVSIIAAGVSKASAVASVAAHVGAEMADVMMVGDGDNDLPAIVAVGWGVAMANAEEEIRAAARIVTGDVDADGAAEIIDRSEHLG